MFRSLRARLLVWYTAMLIVVVAAFGGLVCIQAWRAQVADIDGRLRFSASQLEAALRPAGDGTFDVVLPAVPIGRVVDDGPRHYHVLWDAAGRVIDRSEPDLDITSPPSPGARTVSGRREVTVGTEAGAIILVGRDLADVRRDVRTLAAIVAAVGAGALIVSLAGGWWLVGRALIPVDRIGRTARRMSDGDFSARIPLDRVETELEQLGGAINDAFGRLSESLEQQRRFTADASHELRTPLATLLTETETILSRDRDAASYRESLEVCRRAADRMRVVVERLLLLARADAGDVTMARQPVRLDTLTRRVVADLRAIAAERRVTLACGGDAVTVSGDVNRLTDAITNLVTNAIEYNVPNGRVDISVVAHANGADIRVADTGIGIDSADLPHVFERFYRADPARARVRGGAGLGLAIARWIIVEHGGRITGHSEPGRGSVFTVVLPAVLDTAPGARGRTPSSAAG
jgi:two-component system OmpR family sensor kinase